jgi:hypothetical protein
MIVDLAKCNLYDCHWYQRIKNLYHERTWLNFPIVILIKLFTRNFFLYRQPLGHNLTSIPDKLNRMFLPIEITQGQIGNSKLIIAHF